MSNQQKMNIRRKVRAELRLLSADEKRERSGRLFGALAATAAFASAKTVLLFWSLPDEVFTHDFLEEWSKEKTFLLPVVVGSDMVLRKYEGRALMREGAFGILEPSGEEFVDYNEIDLAIVPGVAFTEDGCRMGRGKGYYDRFLPKLKAVKIGVCFAEQIQEQLPCEPWDIKMDSVIKG